jgi:hypothetical protein
LGSWRWGGKTCDSPTNMHGPAPVAHASAPSLPSAPPTPLPCSPTPPPNAQVGTPASDALLAGFEPRPYAELINGRTVAQAGCVPILHMRHFQTAKELSPALVADIRGRHAELAAGVHH